MQNISELKIKIIGQKDIIFKVIDNIIAIIFKIKDLNIKCTVGELQDMIINELMNINVNYGFLNKSQIKILIKGSVIPCNFKIKH